METESKEKKCSIMVGSCLNWVVATVIASLFLAWASNAHQIQKAFKKDDTCVSFTMHDFKDSTDPVNSCDAIFYDVGFEYYYEG